MNLANLDPAALRNDIVGVDSSFPTPFGERLMVYCDYTASGRCLGFVERYLMQLQRRYANTHTEDDITGRSMTRLLHRAEQMIKDSVNAGPHGRVICTGTGSTAAIDKLQQIIGVALPPASRAMLLDLVDGCFGEDAAQQLTTFLRQHQPVVFVGPYEHHSNEVTWREGLASVQEVRLATDGGIDLEHLAQLLKAPEHQGRLRIGSFSAASNVTGLCSPVREIATLLHQHDCLACFDYAASAPYVDIDMNPAPDGNGGDASLDAVFISPHKFLGGPGSCGVLVFKESLYHRELPPSVSGGGTVDYVSTRGHAFIDDIEEREKAGTPGVLQTMKAALAFEIKSAITVPRIEARELQLLKRAFACWQANPGIEILGNPDPERRISIVSFNIRDPRGNYLHPKLVTMLLNDLFGIQSRAGCSCAGPYGHRLLGIDDDTSQRYQDWISKGYQGIKPGWCRVGFHYVMDDAEADYVIDAVDFLATNGHHFLSEYVFDLKGASWSHRGFVDQDEPFSLAAAVGATVPSSSALSAQQRRTRYHQFLTQARELAAKLARQGGHDLHRLEGDLGELQFFTLET